MSKQKQPEHALLSASAAHRWLHCTAAPRIEEKLPESTSEYAEAGTVAHALCELKLRRKYANLSTRSYNSGLKKLKANKHYDPEMDKHTDTYVEFVDESAMGFETAPHVTIEAKLDYSHIAPEGFGTGDCILIGGDTIQITDFKYGQGVPVSAEKNSQMMLYALGALKQYGIIFGDTIQNVRMAIVQPRLNSISTYEMKSSELEAWGQEIKPIAQRAYSGDGPQKPGDWCRFCRARATCRARSENATALEDFDFLKPPMLSDAEVGDILKRAQNLKSWVTDLEDYALSAVLDGKDIPGFKAVEGRSVRKFSDVDAAFAAIQGAGYPEEILYERNPLSLAKLEKALGAKDFEEIAGQFIIKPPGKPTLVPDSDKRPAYSSAQNDFKNVVNQ